MNDQMIQSNAKLDCKHESLNAHISASVFGAHLSLKSWNNKCQHGSVSHGLDRVIVTTSIIYLSVRIMVIHYSEMASLFQDFQGFQQTLTSVPLQLVCISTVLLRLKTSLSHKHSGNSLASKDSCKR